MRKTIEIENIYEMRRREGIYDAALRDEIQGLQAGAYVHLTFLIGLTPAAGEMLLVRITTIKGDVFRGRLFSKPSLNGLTTLQRGSLITFSKEHIHSILKEPPNQH